MSLTTKFIEDLLEAVSNYTKQFDKKRPMPPHRAQEVQNLLEMLAKSNKQNGISNPLKIRSNVILIIEDMYSNPLAKFWKRLNLSDLRYRLLIVVNNPDYSENKLLSDHLTELAEWAKNQSSVELRKQNEKLSAEINALQNQIHALEQQNLELTEENSELQVAVERLTAENKTLFQENQVISEKNKRLAERYTHSLGKIKLLEAEKSAMPIPVRQLKA